MKTKSHMKLSWKTLIALTLTFLFISTSSVSSTYALPNMIGADSRRLAMLGIAEAYANYTWTATSANVWHASSSSYGNGETTEPGLNPAYPPPHPIDTNAAILIDTPNLGYPYEGYAGWWVADGVTENEGVPYAAGGSTTIDKIALPTNAEEQGLSFYEKLSYGFPAGDITGALDPNVGSSLYTNGVDCVGLINMAWQLGSRVGMSDLKSEFARPIKFKELQAGDILMDSTNHVMLFKEFLNYNSSGGDPVEGDTQFTVYEASYTAGKVKESTYTLGTITPVLPTNDPDKVGWWKNYPLSETVSVTDKITIQGSSLVYIPRTDDRLTPIDIVLVIDKSGSMSSNMERTKEAAQTFVDMMREGDRLAVVAFNENHQQVYYPGENTLAVLDNAQKGIAKEKIQNEIFAGGGTSIGAGLRQALVNIANAPLNPDAKRVVILMSDGYGVGYDAALSSDLRRYNVIVHTLGIGNSVDSVLLNAIASDNFGYYQWINSTDKIQWTLNSIREKIYGVNTVVQATPSATITAGATVNESMLVDSAMGSMTVSFFKSGAGPSLTLTQPNGSTVDINAPNVTYISDTYYESYTILAPQTGEWTTSISSSVAGKYSLSTSTMDAMTFSASTDQDHYLSGTPIKVTASVNDSTSGSLTADPAYIHGAVMQVVIENPALAQSTINLYDDGQHDDSNADDGIYSNTFINTVLEGNYSFNVQVSGNNNRDGQPFTREKILSAVVVSPPTVVSSVRTYGDPTYASTVDFRVTFSRSVTGVDVSDFTLTTTGVSDAAISSVSGSGSVYTVTVNTGVNDGTIRLDVLDDDTIVDADSYPLDSGFTTGQTYTIDKTFLYVLSSVRTSVSPTKAATVDFGVTFSRSVTGVDVSDFTLTTTGVSDAAISSVSGSGSVYTVTVNTGVSDGTIRLDILDDDTIVGADSYPLDSGFTTGQTYTIDKTNPTVLSSVRASINFTTYYNVNYTVTFSEPVTGVNSSDFILTTDGISDASVSGISGYGGVYNVTINTGNGSGTIHLDVVDDDTIADSTGSKLGGAGSGNGDFSSGEDYNIDKTTISTTVSKPEDTNDGICDTDCSIQEAIASAAPGDTVTFDAELAGETIHLVSTLTLSRNITIDASNLIEPVIISGDTDNNGTGDVQVLKVNSGVVSNLNGLTISKGKAINAGGGVYNAGTLTIINSTVSSSSGSYGGGIYNSGTLTITNSTILSNSAILFGGGGINNAGTLTITNSTISNNNASTVSEYGGGGIYNRGTLSMMDSTLFNNSVSSMGGGIYNYDYGTTSITNSTLSSNSAGTAGGGIYNTGSLTLINDTFSNGSAPSGGGIVNGGSKILNYSNTIIANSMSGGDCINNGALGTNTQNLVEDGSCSAILSGDPNLGSLADNGGFTKTIALLSGSSAIDAGDITTCANAPVNNLDQRGVTRPQGGQCDIGAYEGYIDPATMPVVDTFTAVSFSANLNISITEFTASDDEGVTGYLITQSPVPPSANDAGWSGTPPTIYTVSAEATYTLYPWVKDASSYISSAFTLPITVTVSLPTATPTMTSTPTQTPSPTETPTATPTATPYPNILVDEFDNPSLSAYWEWYVPKAGPTYSLSTVPGSLRMNLPAGDSFEHWGDVNNSPQLRLKNFGAGDWAIETRLENVDAAADAGYWASLEVGFAGSDQIWFGMVDDDYLKSIRLSEGEYFAVGAGLPITLRLEKVGEAYTFKYKYDSDLTWTVMPVINSVGTPTYVGLIGRGIWTGSEEMHMDWSYFRVENWTAATPTPLIPTLTSTLTSTPTETPTSTPTFTPTATDTPTSTPTDTPTSTPTDTSTPTVTYTPTNTLTSTPTAPPTDTGTPTSTSTVTNTPAPVGSGWISPAAHAAVTSGSGDNNGFQTSPANVYSDNASFAVDTNSGTNTNTACNNSGKDRHVFYTYNFSSIPSGSTILGIEARLDMKADSTTGAPKSCIELSWNGGTTWTAAKTSNTFTTTEATYILGSGTDTWGRAWTTSELSNFRVRITNVASNNSRDFSLDWAPVRISYLPPAPTSTFTVTPPPSFTPTSTHTSTPTVTYTPTFTPTNTPTPTATPTQTDAPIATNTPTITPTHQPGVILDEFNSALLNPDWEWYVPLVGPNYSLAAEPGHLQLAVQPNKDHWANLDESPQVRRTDMGDGDWAIETYLSLDDTNAGDAWQVNLVAGFDRYDQQWLSIDSGNELHVRRVGAENDTALVCGISLPLYLRMERTGTDYTFKYKKFLADPWTTVDVQSINNSVAYVGVQFRTFNSTGDAVFSMDYFRMESSNPPDVGPEKEIEVDDFDSLTLNGDWTWYVPKSGPTYSLATVPGSFHMNLPALESFEHLGNVDDAPQLRRSDLGSGDWAIETQLVNIDATNAGYWAVLEVGFDQFDQIWYGMVDDGNLKIYRVSEGEYAFTAQSLPLILRLEKHGEEYVFKYRQDPNEAWTVFAPKTYAGTPAYVGLIARAFDTGSADMQIDWSYFRLERWTPLALMAAPQSINNTQGITESDSQSQQEERIRPTPTPTRAIIPSPTLSPTLSPTPRATRTSSPTPTYTPAIP